MNDVVKEVTVNRNTIVVVAQFTTIRDDVPLFADGLEVHPLVFNAEDRLHYSMIWLEPQQTIHKLEAKGTDAMATGSWSPLPT
ncbi:MAG TPA: hypothetical protein P5121_34060, partial [Caldilineaceae bacterium]|nr:hypothetical protein [Caldilineaceae bacterium]